MKTLVASLLAVAAVAVAAPAGAQAWGYDRGRDRTFHPEIQARIDQGVRSGRLTRWEAQRLYAELRDLDRLELRYRASGGLDRRERADLEARTYHLKTQVWREKHDWDNRGGRYDDRYR
jgi:hypothetical protein